MKPVYITYLFLSSWGHTINRNIICKSSIFLIMAESMVVVFKCAVYFTSSKSSYITDSFVGLMDISSTSPTVLMREKIIPSSSEMSIP